MTKNDIFAPSNMSFRERSSMPSSRNRFFSATGKNGSSSSKPISGKKVIPRCQSVFKVIISTSSVGSASSGDSNVGSGNEVHGQKSIYERLTWQQQHDEACQRDLAHGRRIGFYKFKSELGTGNFSKVKMGIHLPTKEKVAIKIIDKRKLDSKTSKMVSKEIAIMDTLSHPHLIRLYEVCETMTNLYLMMEYAPGGELFTRLNSQGPYEEREAKYIFVQVTSAVEYMHEKKFVHRDLKAENVFFSTQEVVKVGDFGFATQVSATDQQLNTFCGSPPYAAPELFQDDHYFGYSVDIWALGILLYFLLTSTMPFKGQTVAALKSSILEGSFQIPDFLSYEAHELIKGILRRQPSTRWTLKEIQKSPWLLNMDWIQGDDSFRANPSLQIVNDPREEERQTLDKLSEIGITKELILSHSQRGPRSQVLGTYRIILHRFMKGNKIASLDGNDSFTASMNSTRSAGFLKKSSPPRLTNGTKQNLKKSPKSRTCVLL